MALTASEAETLTRAIGRWEYAEYVFTALVAIACFGEYIADFTEWWRHGRLWNCFGDIEHRKDKIAKLSTLVLIGALAGELVCVVRTNQLSGALLGSLSNRSEEAFTKSADALRNADAAMSQSSSAIQNSLAADGQSMKATQAASSAVVVAREARREADSFERDIVSAKKQAMGAEAHLKEALASAEAAATLAKGYEKQIADAKRDASEAKSLLSEARQLAAEARQQAVEATKGVDQLKSDRSLKNAADLSVRLKEFANTQYTFSGVFGDAESVLLVRQIDGVLRLAGWQRIKGALTFPALEIFGKDDGANVIVAIGVNVSAESPESLTTLQALAPTKLPRPLNAAVALAAGLSSNIFPPDTKAKTVAVGPGTSNIVAIAVGRKP